MALTQKPHASDAFRRASFGGFPSRTNSASPIVRVSIRRTRAVSPYASDAIAGVRTLGAGSEDKNVMRDINLLASDPAHRLVRAFRSPASSALYTDLSEDAGYGNNSRPSSHLGFAPSPHSVRGSDEFNSEVGSSSAVSPASSTGRFGVPDLLWSMDDDEMPDKSLVDNSKDVSESSNFDEDAEDNNDDSAVVSPRKAPIDRMPIKLDESLVLLSIADDELRQSLADSALERHREFARAAELREHRVQASLQATATSNELRRERMQSRIAQEEARRSQAVQAALDQRNREAEESQRASVTQLEELITGTEVSKTEAGLAAARALFVKKEQEAAGIWKVSSDQGQKVSALFQPAIIDINDALKNARAACDDADAAIASVKKGGGATALAHMRSAAVKVDSLSKNVVTAHEALLAVVADVQAKITLHRQQQQQRSAEASGAPKDAASQIKPLANNAQPQGALAVVGDKKTVAPGVGGAGAGAGAVTAVAAGALTVVAAGAKAPRAVPKLKLPKEFVSPVAYEDYERRTAFWVTAHNSLKAFNEDKSLGRTRIDAKKIINTAINTISATADQVTAKIASIHALLKQSAPNQVMYNYCLDLFASKIVCQGDSQVHVHQASAFPIAAVTIGTCLLHPATTPLLMAHLYKKCPYIVPFYHPQKDGQRPEDYMREIGYEEAEEGVLETEEKYFERMSGIVALYAAMLQTPNQAVVSLDDGWAWLARVLNMPPRKITPSIILAFLQVAGPRLSQRFRNQFRKVLEFLREDYIPRMPQRTATAAIKRLEMFVDDALRNGRLPRPEEGLDDIFLRINTARIV